MSSPRALMRPFSAFVCSLGLAMLPSVAAAQSRIDFVSRQGGTTTAVGRIGLRDCATETWTFSLTVTGTHTGTPTLWLSRGDTCAMTSGDASCVRLTDTALTRTTDRCAGDSCWQFPVTSRRLIDPVTASCDTRGTGATRLFATIDGVVVASPRVLWDTVIPAAPRNVSASYGSESEVRLAWSYPTESASTADASTDVTDASDASDDASDASAADASTTPDATVTDAGVTSTFESVRRFWVLCDPVTDAGVDAGSNCATGGFSGLNVNDTASLVRFANQCNEGDGGIDTTATGVSLANLAAGQAYRFAVVAEDLAGNRSAATAASSCRAAEAYTDFWERYRQAGGEAKVGCAARPGASREGLWACVALAGLALAARRRR